jgi:FkbM family methyltransferase
MDNALRTFRWFANLLSMRGRVPIFQALFRRAFRKVHRTISVRDFDGDLTISLRLSEHMQRRMFWMGYYNRDIVALLDRMLTPGMVLIDVGANIGEISLVAAKRVGPEGRVIAFEPVDRIADVLESNMARNGLRQALAVRYGLSDHNTSAPIYASCGQGEQNDENDGLGSLYGAAAETAPLQYVTLRTLDDYLEENPLDRVDFIKIDIEGAELPCLRGSARTIERFRPMLIIEVQRASATMAGYSVEDTLGFLAERHYRFASIGRSGRLRDITLETLGDYQNVLCMPIGGAVRPPVRGS